MRPRAQAADPDRVARRRPARPAFTGVRVLDNFPLATLREFIDWTPFFHTWELKGVYPRILEDERQGAQARQIFTEANALLDRIIEKNLITARGVYGFFPANAVGDDVELYTDETRGQVLDTIPLPPPASKQGRQRAVPVARRLHRAEGNRAARSHRCFRGNQRDRPEGAVRPVPGRARRLQRDHGGGHRRSPGRSFRRMPAQARARWNGVTVAKKA